MNCSFSTFLRGKIPPLFALLFVLGTSLSIFGEESKTSWVASWQASPQAVWHQDFLFPTNVPDTLHKQTVRQVARISVGGERVRILLSNTYGTEPLTIGGVSVALAADETGALSEASLRRVTFERKLTTSIPAGTWIESDAIDLPVPDLARLVINVYLPEPMSLTTFHWDARQTSWILDGDQLMSIQTPGHDSSMQSTTARLLLSGIHVGREGQAKTVVVLGDSITDGATASLDADTRWPDFLAARLAPHGIGVVNAGISGARILSDGMGESALARFERDVVMQPGVESVIVMLGINDIAWPGTAFAPSAKRPTLTALNTAYRQLVDHAHAHGIRVIGATLTPFEDALPGTPLSDYYHPDKDRLRQELNGWIRDSGTFDAVVDFDAALRDPEHPLRLAPRFDSGDHLHPGDEGNRALAEAIDLNVLFANPLAGTEENK